MPIVQLMPSFNAGEISPLLDARVQLEKYHSGCKRLENFIILPYGGALNRAGTEMMGLIGNPNRRARLIGFNFSTTTSFILELGEEYMRFWSNGQQVIDPNDEEGEAPLEVATPYLESHLREIQYAQVNDLVYFAHPDHPVHKLTRLDDDDWQLEEVDWDWPPFLDENIEETTITPSATTGEAITLDASEEIWTPEHRGSFWLIGHRRDDAFRNLSLSGANGTTSGMEVLGEWELTTYGNWRGTLRVQRSTDGGVTWETLRTFTNANAGDRNVSATGEEEDTAELRLSWDSDGSGSANPNATLEVADNRVFGVVHITDIISGIEAQGNVVSDLYSTDATKVWAEGAWNGHQGYPRSVALHEQRIVYGGTGRRPLTVWGSVSDDFENFRYSTREDAAFSFTLAAGESNPINWMISQGPLLIGTAGEEWTLGPADEAQIIGPTNVNAERQSAYGSKYFQARIVNEVVLFIQRQGRKVREQSFLWEKDSWVAPDLTILAEHITAGEIEEASFQKQPHSLLWCVTGDGGLIGMTYEREQNVIGWHRHSTDGIFESVATIYGGSGPDEVWFVVRREINGTQVRFVERMKVDFYDQWEAENKSQWWYLDCATRYDIAGASHVTGLEYLEGKEVGVFADGAVHPHRTVANGRIDLQHPATNVLVGLPFTSNLQTMKLDAMLENGTAQGRRSRVPKVSARFHKTLGAEISLDGNKWIVVPFRRVPDPMDKSPDPFTGEHDIDTLGGYKRGSELHVRQVLPCPCCLLALIPRVEFFGE